MKNFFVLLFVIAISNSYGQVPLSDIDLQGNRKQVLPASNAQPSFSPMAGNTWTSIGPFGGDITDMSGKQYFIEKNKIAACRDCSFFRSCWNMQEYNRLIK